MPKLEKRSVRWHHAMSPNDIDEEGDAQLCRSMHMDETIACEHEVDAICRTSNITPKQPCVSGVVAGVHLNTSSSKSGALTCRILLVFCGIATFARTEAFLLQSVLFTRCMGFGATFFPIASAVMFAPGVFIIYLAPFLDKWKANSNNLEHGENAWRKIIWSNLSTVFSTFVLIGLYASQTHVPIIISYVFMTIVGVGSSMQFEAIMRVLSPMPDEMLPFYIAGTYLSFIVFAPTNAILGNLCVEPQPTMAYGNGSTYNSGISANAIADMIHNATILNITRADCGGNITTMMMPSAGSAVNATGTMLVADQCTGASIHWDRVWVFFGISNLLSLSTLVVFAWICRLGVTKAAIEKEERNIARTRRKQRLLKKLGLEVSPVHRRTSLKRELVTGGLWRAVMMRLTKILPKSRVGSRRASPVSLSDELGNDTDRWDSSDETSQSLLATQRALDAGFRIAPSPSENDDTRFACIPERHHSELSVDSGCEYERASHIASDVDGGRDGGQFHQQQHAADYITAACTYEDELLCSDPDVSTDMRYIYEDCPPIAAMHMAGMLCSTVEEPSSAGTHTDNAHDSGGGRDSENDTASVAGSIDAEDSKNSALPQMFKSFAITAVSALLSSQYSLIPQSRAPNLATFLLYEYYVVSSIGTFLSMGWLGTVTTSMAVTLLRILVLPLAVLYANDVVDTTFAGALVYNGVLMLTGAWAFAVVFTEVKQKFADSVAQCGKAVGHTSIAYYVGLCVGLGAAIIIDFATGNQ